MKTLIALTLLAFIFVGCDCKPDYEFHSGSDGQVMWQCNRKTGEIKIFTSYTATYEIWRGGDYFTTHLTSQTPSASPFNCSKAFGDRSILLPYFFAGLSVTVTRTKLPLWVSVTISFVPMG
jgi:hypothetical protein